MKTSSNAHLTLKVSMLEVVSDEESIWLQWLQSPLAKAFDADKISF